MNLKKSTAALLAAILISGTAAVPSLHTAAVNENLHTTAATKSTDIDTKYNTNTQKPTTTAPPSTQATTAPKTAVTPAQTTAPVTTKKPEQTTKKTSKPSVTSKTTAATSKTTPTTTLPEDASSAAATISLDISKVKNGNFTAKLNINSEANIGKAKIKVRFDEKQLTYVKNTPNYDIGGNFDGKYEKGVFTFDYTNSISTAFDGDFTTLSFRIKDNTVASTVIYIEVETLKNELEQNVAHNEMNGIVKNNEVQAVTTEKVEEYVPVTLNFSKSPVSLDKLGIKNAVGCEVENTDVLVYADSKLTTLKAGTSRMTVIYKNGKKGYFTVTVKKSAETTVATTQNTNIPGTRENQSSKNNIWVFIVIILLAVAAIAVCLIIYITTVKTKKSKTYNNDEYEEDFKELDLSDNDSEN